MGKIIQLRASDDHQLEAYRAEPAGNPKAGLVILQEVFGVTRHIRRVADEYAAEGFLAIAPNLFDRVEPGLNLDYSAVDRGRATMMQLDLEEVVIDVAAAAESVRSAGNVGAVGYCWGGAIADLAACRIQLAAGASYYGRMIVEWLDLKPGCPMIYHFGEQDPLIPAEAVQQIQNARPDGDFYVYPDAGHGFNCEDRAAFHPESAQLARERTLNFFNKNL